MKKVLITILLVIMSFSACKKSSNSTQTGPLDFLSSDQTTEAAKIIEKTNNDELKKVKQIYRDNQNRKKDLIEAIKANNLDESKNIANNLVSQINEGIVLADSAVSKIQEAEDLNINSTYKEYLRLKKEALRKQIEAFRLRLESAQDISKANNAEELKKVAIVIIEREKDFDTLIDEGKALSQEANQIAKNAAKSQSK